MCTFGTRSGATPRPAVRLAVPVGWTAEPAQIAVSLAPLGEVRTDFVVRPMTHDPVRRARIGADLTVDGARFGQQAEALVTIR